MSINGAYLYGVTVGLAGSAILISIIPKEINPSLLLGLIAALNFVLFLFSMKTDVGNVENNNTVLEVSGRAMIDPHSYEFLVSDERGNQIRGTLLRDDTSVLRLVDEQNIVISIQVLEESE